MRTALVASLALTAAVAAPVPKALKPKRPDAEVFVGRWEAVDPGRETEMYGKSTWTIDERLGLKIAYPEEGGRFTTWDIKLAPEKSAKEIDIGGLKGIYEIDGDEIKVAYGSERPTSLAPGRGVNYHLLRRVREQSK